MSRSNNIAWITLILCLVPGCSLPLVKKTEMRDLDWQMDLIRPRVETCQTKDGAELRGILVPVENAKGLVLHFLPRGAESHGGIEGFAGFSETLVELAGQGYSSLVFDYRGVGASAGEIDSDRLEEDAAAMWQAALGLVSGRNERIILRAASLGSLAVASILSRGAEPRAIIMAAPIDADTIKAHALDRELGSFLGFLAAPFYRSAAIKGLGPTCHDFRGPGLIILAEDDSLLPPEEWQLIRAKVAQNLQIVESGLDHESLVLRFYGFELSEMAGRVNSKLMTTEQKFLESLDG